MAGQSKRHSLMESLLNTFIGFWIAVGSQYVVFPLFGLYTDFKSHVLIGSLFTIVSIIRSYYIRRLFNYMHVRGVLK